MFQVGNVPANSLAFARDVWLTAQLAWGGDECWDWPWSKNSEGYALLRYEGRVQRAHRVLYAKLIGPIDDGLELDHLCRNRGCVNPWHLQPVTRKENILRGEGMGARFARRSHCKHGHELTDANIYRYKGSRMCRTCHNERTRQRRARTYEAQRCNCYDSSTQAPCPTHGLPREEVQHVGTSAQVPTERHEVVQPSPSTQGEGAEAATSPATPAAGDHAALHSPECVLAAARQRTAWRCICGLSARKMTPEEHERYKAFLDGRFTGDHAARRQQERDVVAAAWEAGYKFGCRVIGTLTPAQARKILNAVYAYHEDWATVDDISDDALLALRRIAGEDV